MFLVAKLKGDTTDFVAAQQIVISITSLIFMIPQSIGIASTARIGYFWVDKPIKLHAMWQVWQS